MAPIGSKIYTAMISNSPIRAFRMGDRWEGAHIHGEYEVIQCVLQTMLIGTYNCVTCMKDFQLTNIIYCQMIHLHPLPERRNTC